MRRPFAPLRLLAAVLAVCLAGAVGSAHAMTLALQPEAPCGPQACIVLSGDIDRTSAEQFETFVKQEGVKSGALVLLNSPGGDHQEGLLLGAAIRKLGLNTAVGKPDPDHHRLAPATCSSACTYVFVGGVERTLAKGSRLGVHQVRPDVEIAGESLSDVQWAMGLVAVHLKRMGVSFDVLTLALTTPPQRMYWLSSDELQRFSLVTPAALTTAGG